MGGIRRLSFMIAVNWISTVRHGGGYPIRCRLLGVAFGPRGFLDKFKFNQYWGKKQKLMLKIS